MKGLDKLSLEQIDHLIAKKQAMQINQPSSLESFGRGALESATLGFAPKISGALGALYARTLRPELFQEEPFRQTYQQGRDIERENTIRAQQANPKSSIAGGLLGAAVLPFPAKNVKGAAGLGAGYGAGYGLGTSDTGEVGNIDTNDILAALYGAGTGSVLGGATQGIVNKFFPVKNPINPETTRNIELSQQYNIPMTKGEFTTNPQELLKEGAIRNGDVNQKSQNALSGFTKNQRNRFDDALDQIKQNIGGGQTSVSKGDNIGQVVGNIQEKAANEREQYSNLYKEATANITKVDTNQIKEFPRLITKDLQESVLTADNVPKTFNEIKSLDNLINTKDVDLKKLEAWKQGVNRTIKEVPQGGQEEFALKQLSQKFDGFLDGVIEKALIEGDTKVLDQFRNARGLAAEYFNKYRAKNNDEFGRVFLEDIIDNARYSREPFSNEMLVNKIFGTSEIGFKPQSASIIKELKKYTTPEDFQSLKLEAGQKLLTPLLKESPNVQTYINNINKFVKNNGTLANELFSKEELKQFSDIGQIAKKIFVREKSLVNPSGTAAFNNYLKKNKTFGLIENVIERNKFEGNQNKIIKELQKGEKTGRQLPVNLPASELSIIDNLKDKQDRLEQLSIEKLDKIIENKKRLHLNK